MSPGLMIDTLRTNQQCLDILNNSHMEYYIINK